MACSNCNTPNCGCSGTYVVSQTCPPACSEVFNASCIVYTGVDLTCTDAVSGLTSTVVSRNDYMDTALTAIVNYICARFNPANLPSSVVVSGDDFVVVNASTVGYVTTYTVTLDPAGLPSASIVEEGENVTVTGDGSAGDPYVVNAENAIVISSSDILTVVPQVGVPSTYTTTYDIEVNEENLPDTILESDTGHVYITETQNSPTAGDTTYTLEVDEVTVETSDDRLAVALTSAGGAPGYERTFDVTIDDTDMANWIMETVIFSSPSFPDGLIAGTGITLNWNPATFQLEIVNDFDDPLRWFELIDFAGFNVTPTSGSAILRILADPATVDAGGDGISAILSGTGTDANFQLLNTDPGSSQLIFGTVAVAGEPDVLATSNTEILTLVEGANIGLVTDNGAKSITIVNEIDFVFSSVAGDTGVVQAANTVDQVQFVGGESITTTAAGGGPATVTIDFDGLTIGAGLAGSGTSIDPLVNNSPATDITLASAGGTSLVSGASANPAFEILGLSAGTGIGLSASAAAITINADVERDDATTPGSPPATVAAGVAKDFTHSINEQYVQIRIIALQANAGFSVGQDITYADSVRITLTGVGQYTIQTATYFGDIVALVVG